MENGSEISHKMEEIMKILIVVAGINMLSVASNSTHQTFTQRQISKYGAKLPVKAI